MATHGLDDLQEELKKRRKLSTRIRLFAFLSGAVNFDAKYGCVVSLLAALFSVLTNKRDLCPMGMISDLWKEGGGYVSPGLAVKIMTLLTDKLKIPFPVGFEVKLATRGKAEREAKGVGAERSVNMDDLLEDLILAGKQWVYRVEVRKFKNVGNEGTSQSVRK
jgi:hypothetical protein